MDKVEPVEVLEQTKPLNLTPEQEAAVKATQQELAEKGTLESRTPEQIALDMIEAEKQSAYQKAEEMGPARMSEQFFRTFWPMYKQRIVNLSNKECRRLLEALVQWPLEEENPVFKSQAAQEAFALGIRLIDSKTIIRDAVELEMLQKQVDKDGGLNYNKEENKGETNNG